MALGFLKSAARTVGKGAGSAVGAVAGAAREVSAQASKVPVIGPGLRGTVNLWAAPIFLASSVAKGDRIDRAVVANLKQQVRDVKDVAPYAQMVISVVPGVGTGASGAISAGLALAEGQPIDKAVIAGVRGALPGGPVAQGAFDAAVAVMEGKPIEQVGIAALPLDPKAKKAIATIAVASRDLAKGKPIDAAAARAAKAYLPKQYQIAVDSGLALAHGQKLQAVVKANVTPAALSVLANEGVKIAGQNSVAKAGLDWLKSTEAQAGYKVALTLSRKDTKPVELCAIRAKLTPKQAEGFDLAMSAQIGAVTSKKKPMANPKAEFAYRVTAGARTLPKSTQKAVVTSLAKDPSMRLGVSAAVTDLSLTARFKAWLKKVLEALK